MRLQAVEFAWLIPIFPLIAGLIVGLIGHRLREGGGYVAITGSAISLIITAFVVAQVLDGSFDAADGVIDGVFEQSRSWLTLSETYSFEIGIYIDQLTALMLVVVSLVSTLVIIYSIAYMGEEGGRKRRYYTEISLFVGVMLGLVLANNYLELFIFWELVGLCSYLLIGFWYHKPSAASAAKKAFIVTRVGDIMFMVGLIILFTTFKTLNFRELFEMEVSGSDLGLLTIGTFMIFGGAIGKSAQFPLHDWLPDAMEGPTTVSALIHAATMVKAGVYLVARSFPLFVQTPDTLMVVAIIGGVTAFMAATMALNNPNIKRVLAYSTISQLGYMMLALGAGGYIFYYLHGAEGYTASMFHLMNHAFFKALLFLCAGSVIHAVNTEDMRLMGGLGKKMKITSFTMLIGALSISGIPPFSGFWSKDEVLATVFEACELNWVFALLYILGIATAFMTAFYMFRLWFMTFAGEEGEASSHAHESPKIMTIPLIILALLAAGSFLVLFVGGGFGSQIFFEEPHALTASEILAVTFTDPLTYLSIAVALCGVGMAYATYYKRTISPEIFVSTKARRTLYNILLNRYGFAVGYNAFAEKVVYGFAIVVDAFDRYVIDGIVNGVAFLLTRAGHYIRKIQTGYVQLYATIIIAAISVIIVLLYLIGGLR
ncbi:MAG: NADH-quinone oxidoreductase subunit L [Methanomassiliicoccales archaeon]